MLAKTSLSKVLGVGVSLPGLIDRDRGMLISSTNMPQWHNVPMAALLSSEFKLPVKVEGSVHLAACHENWSSPSEPDRGSVFLLLRTGIGMSLIHRGEIYSGPLGFDGEIGHTVVDVNGRQCECGGRGCLETFVSASAICERGESLLETPDGAVLRERLAAGDLLRPELIYRLAKEGDPGCTGIVRDVGRYLGIAAANMINLLAPHELIIGGSIDFADELIVDAVKQEIQRGALPPARQRVQVRLAKAQERASVLGAAVLVIQQLFELPRLNHSAILEPAARSMVS
jgi:predicted NBD/HSP70 family sugar kinase